MQINNEDQQQHTNMNLVQRFTKGDMHGAHYAISVMIAAALLWILVDKMTTSSPVWAISSMVATSDPVIKQSKLAFQWRVINALVGCLIGLIAIAVGGPNLVMLPLAMGAAVIVPWYMLPVQTMWRQAPIGAAFVIAAGWEHHSRINGLHAGAVRMGEVLLGCIVGILVAWVVSRVWPLPVASPPQSVAHH